MSSTTGDIGQPRTQRDRILRVYRRHIDAVPVITVEGEVDLSTVGEVREAVDSELTGPPPPGLILDLAGVTFLCSTGLQLLLESDRRTQDSGSALCVVGARREVLRPLQLTGLDAHLRVHPTIEEAVAEIGPTVS